MTDGQCGTVEAFYPLQMDAIAAREDDEPEANPAAGWFCDNPECNCRDERDEDEDD